MNRLDLAHVCIATVLCRRVISEAARRQQIEGLLRDGRVVEEVYFSRTNAMPYGIIIGPQSLLGIMTKIAFVVLCEGQQLRGPV